MNDKLFENIYRETTVEYSPDYIASLAKEYGQCLEAARKFNLIKSQYYNAMANVSDVIFNELSNKLGIKEISDVIVSNCLTWPRHRSNNFAIKILKDDKYIIYKVPYSQLSSFIKDPEKYETNDFTDVII